MLLLPFGRVRPGAIAAVILVAVFAAVIPGVRAQQPRGLVTNLPGAFQGYTVVAPLKSTSTYLVDMDGETVHEWRSRYTPTFGIYVLDNGNLLRAARDPNNSLFNVGGYGGIVQELAWNGGVVWEYRYSSREHIQHHDIELLPNGNILLLAWERMTAP